MRVGIYGRSFDDSFIPNIQELFDTLMEFGWSVSIYQPFRSYLSPRLHIDELDNVFNKHQDIKDSIDVLICIGGDGTFLETINIVRNSGIPILGVNTGR